MSWRDWPRGPTTETLRRRTLEQEAASRTQPMMTGRPERPDERNARQDKEELAYDNLLDDLARAPAMPEHEIRGYLRDTGADLSEPGQLEPKTPVSPKELEVLAQLSIGYTSKQVARRLGKSPLTVKEQIASARKKLSAKTQTHACCEAIRKGLIP
jgi:DNA-binding CsgD family transcriptional regulator